MFRGRRPAMSNQLKMATIQTILSLRAQRWSFRRIARELGVPRDTGARYVLQSEPKPAKAPLGSDETPSTSQPAANPPPTTAPPPGRSGCEPWRETILTKFATGLSAQRIYPG